MSPVQDWLKRLQPGGGAQRRFEGWPSVPTIKPVPAGRLGACAALVILPDIQHNPLKYGKAIVIGLGSTGERVLRQWLDQMIQDPAGLQDQVCAVLVTGGPAASLPTGRLLVRQFATVRGEVVASPAVAGLRGRRHELQRLFRSMVNLDPFQNCLNGYIGELKTNIRVIILGSLAEPEIGCLGDVLQTLLLGRNRPTSFLAITALLTLASPAPILKDEEVYAALREIGRFTFSGLHWMEAPAGARSGCIEGALLDQLLLVQDVEPPGLGLEAQRASFDQGVGQAMAESLWLLLHPAAGPIWEHLQNDLTRGAEARNETHEVVVNSLSVATLHVPLNEVQAYVAIRLACAALYGEHPTHPTEGLLATEIPAESYLPGELLARRWFRGTDEDKPGAPYLFEWLLEANGAAYFQLVPQLSEEYRDVFPSQLAHGLTVFLNDDTQVDHLPQAGRALQWLVEFLDRLDGWFKGAPVSDRSTRERLAFQALLNHWRKRVAGLQAQVEDWERVLLPPRPAAPGAPAWSGEAAAMAPSEPDWQSAFAAVANLDAEVQPSSPVPPVRNLFDWMMQARQAAEDALAGAVGGRYRCALTGYAQDPLKEANAYYQGTFRPELSRYGVESSPAFRRVRGRLGWWVDLVPGQEPRLYLLCLAAGVSGQGAPPPAVRYAPQDVPALGQALLDLARVQAYGRAADLTGHWMEQRLDALSGFLSRANQPLLDVDWELAANRSCAPIRRGYLVGKDRVLARKYQDAAFPDFPPSQLNDLGEGEPTRLTALGLWVNIPLEAVRPVRQAYGHYFHQEQMHLYPQERHATLYEQRIRTLTGQWQLLPAEVALVLADRQLVSLFCQALICGLIDVRTDEFGQKPCWTLLLPDDGGRPPVRLAPADGSRDLWQALVGFALRLPNDPSVDQRPADPFHPNNRRRFLDDLAVAVQTCRQSESYAARRLEFERTHLSRLQERGQRDALARALAELLAVELDDLQWRTW